MLKEGEKAPSWTAKDQSGETHSSEKYLRSWLLLYFYPKDDTPGCTIEACGFRDAYADLLNKVTILGVSADSAESHQRFVKKYNLPFPLLVDTEKELLKKFVANGVLLPKRVTFLIDPKGVIQKIYTGFDCNDHAADVLHDLEMIV